jgi:hypothetical protein
MNTTWVNTAEERFAQTLSGVRLKKERRNLSEVKERLLQAGKA